MNANNAKRNGYRVQCNLGNAPWVLFAAVSLNITFLGCDTRNGSVNTGKPSGEVQPLFTPEVATLAQQKMCDEQASKKFHEERYSGFEKKGNLPITSYTSHYDSAVNVCYVRVNSFGGNPLAVSAVVYDAFGGRVFASYLWINAQNKKYWEVSPSECDIDIPGKPEEKCTTDTEFDELTEKYFGITKG